jgi:hypothetical protein
MTSATLAGYDEKVIATLSSALTAVGTEEETKNTLLQVVRAAQGKAKN